MCEGTFSDFAAQITFETDCCPMTQLDARPTGDQEVVGSTPAGSGNILSWRFDHGIFSTVFRSLPLIQEGQLSVTGERMCKKYWLDWLQSSVTKYFFLTILFDDPQK